MDPAAERQRTVEWQDPVTAARTGRGLSGLDYLTAMQEGRIPRAPVAALICFTIADIAVGRVAMELDPAEFHYNPLASVHGGIVATLLDSVMGCAVHSTLPRGRGYTTLEIKVNYVRTITAATGRVRAEGTSIHVGRRTATAEGRLVDAAGRLYAHATTTCLVFALPETE